MAALTTFLRKAYMIGARYTGVSSLLSPVLGGVGAILMLHHVSPRQSGCGLNAHLCVTPDFLQRLLEGLRDDGVVFVSMDEAADRLSAGHGDEHFIAVTLDDGYRDNLQYAAPVFRALDVPYTIHVCPGLIDGAADLWWELLERVVDDHDAVTYETADGPKTLDCRSVRQKHYNYCVLMEHATQTLDEDAQRVFIRQLSETYGIDRDEHRRTQLMGWDEIASLATDRLAAIGAHTVNHYQLRRLERDRALSECVRSADILEERLGERPRHFAFPYGKQNAAGAREVELAREAGFTTAVTTRHGVLLPGHAERMHALPRISVNGYYQRVGYVQTMLTGITVPAANYGRRLVTV